MSIIIVCKIGDKSNCAAKSNLKRIEKKVQRVIGIKVPSNGKMAKTHTQKETIDDKSFIKTHILPLTSSSYSLQFFST